MLPFFIDTAERRKEKNMVSKQKEICYHDNGKAYNKYSFTGLSTDDKPTFDGLGNGSSFFEMNTCKMYFYDAENKTWVEAK